MKPTFESRYPNVAHFVDAIGWIEIGTNDDTPLTSFIRALDIGGMIWEGEDSYPSLDAAFADLEQALIDWMEEVGIKPE